MGGLTAALIAAEAGVHVKLRQLAPQLRRAVSAELFVKQFEDAERDVSEALAPLFERQIRSIAEGLKDLGAGSTGGSAAGDVGPLIAAVFDPKEWHDELVDLLLPVLAQKAFEAAYAHLLSLGLDVRSKRTVPRAKATTASRWLAENSEDFDALTEAMRQAGLPIGFATEMPTWMKRSVSRHLSTSFMQDYWKTIHETTAGDAERFLRQGLAEGHSIDKIARSMRSHFMGEDGTKRYAMRRARTIARTEAGNALNGARKAANDRLKEEMGAEVPMKQSWLSVLGNTTRASHADLDGVPEDENGLWNLSGHMIPWPGHYSLPVAERANCQCTLTVEFGMDDDEALQLIQEHEDRVAEREKPTGDEVETRPPEVPGPVVVEPPARVGPEEPAAISFANMEEAKRAFEDDFGFYLSSDLPKAKGVKASQVIANEYAHMKSKFPEVRKYMDGGVREALDVLNVDRLQPRGGGYALGTYNEQGRITKLAGRMHTRKGAKPRFGKWDVGSDMATLTRHEYAHRVWSKHVPMSIRNEWNKMARKKYVGKSLGKRKVSKYGASDSDELFAESFAAYTSPAYKQGSLPEDIESFLSSVLGG